MPTSSSSRNCNNSGVASPTRATSSTRGDFDLALVLQVLHHPLIFRLSLWFHTVRPPFPFCRLLRCPCASGPSFLSLSPAITLVRLSAPRAMHVGVHQPDTWPLRHFGKNQQAKIDQQQQQQSHDSPHNTQAMLNTTFHCTLQCTKHASCHHTAIA